MKESFRNVKDHINTISAVIQVLDLNSPREEVIYDVLSNVIADLRAELSKLEAKSSEPF